MTSRRLIFATDFGPAAHAAIPQIVQLAKAYDASIGLLHVHSSAWVEWAAYGLTDGELHSRMGSWQADLIARGAQADEPHVAYGGSTAQVIVEHAESSGAQLIAIGSGDKSLVDRFVTGTTAESVARTARMPVWVARASARHEVRRVLCGVDATEASVHVLEAGLLLRRQLGAALTVASVVDRPDIGDLAVRAGAEQVELQRYERDRRDAFTRLLERYAAELEHVERRQLTGRASDCLQRTAEEGAFDLLVVGRAEPSRLARFLLGSTAERLLRRSPCSLLLTDRPLFAPAGTGG